ncbi:MAG: UDP-2,3-diacylglucosamine diphosphatase [Gemmatimonadota bacterium]|nr:UDP-2,3-diacylglucosamine diphosphatase [Gemmatimonadota bacterium]
MRADGTLILSDAHLGAVSPDREARLLEFLESVPGRTRDLVIDGDLFDFWFEWRTVVLARHFGALRRLRDIADAGVRIRLVAGNHDAWGGAFLRDEVGIELLEGPVDTTLGGRRALLAHGDGLGSGDLGYRVLRRIIRSRPARRGFRWLHPDLSAHLVRRVSRTETRRDADTPDDASLRRARHLEAWAVARLAERPDLEIIVLAHCHVPGLRTVAPGRAYVNPGDWVHHCTWAEVEPDAVRVMRWDGGRGTVLHELQGPGPARGPDRPDARDGAAQGPTGTE